MRNPREKFAFKGQGKNRDKQQNKTTTKSGRPVRRAGMEEPGEDHVMEGTGEWSLGRRRTEKTLLD